MIVIILAVPCAVTLIGLYAAWRFMRDSGLMLAHLGNAFHRSKTP